MSEKNRPKAEVRYDYGCDGRDSRYYIAYFCPTCGKGISGYKNSNACDRCGTFYDWGRTEPSIKVARTVDWE